eukprot:GEMP01129424.1.p2 GENE.GEMP01129424.1~~GEMP01129424.1.p2  ORF type:complete len:100 (-),score=4.38 GEMP01129424.1:60-359(-)
MYERRAPKRAADSLQTLASLNTSSLLMSTRRPFKIDIEKTTQDCMRRIVKMGIVKMVRTNKSMRYYPTGVQFGRIMPLVRLQIRHIGSNDAPPPKRGWS